MATVKELRVIAKELGLKGYSTLRKADLISLIEEQRNANIDARTARNADLIATNPIREEDRASVIEQAVVSDINIDTIAEDELYDPELHLRPEDQGVEVEQLRAALEVAYARIAELELELHTTTAKLEEAEPMSWEEMVYERNKVSCDREDEQAMAKEQAAIELFKHNTKARNLVPRHTCHNNSRVIEAMIEVHPEVKRTQYGWTLTLDGVTSYHHYATSVLNTMTNYFAG
jgi:hypothetical protein